MVHSVILLMLLIAAGSEQGSSVEPFRHYGPSNPVSCLARIERPHPEFAPLTELDSFGDLVNDFIGRPGQGKLCEARVFTVAPEGENELKVYRAWNNGAGRKWGRWWSFNPPSNFGNEAIYRRHHGLCPSEGPADKLDRVLVCTLRVDAEFAVGPGQSKDCPDGVTVPQTQTNQVYMPMGPATFSQWVTRCEVFTT